MFFSKREKVIRKFSFRKDQDGIINRYLRERSGWQSHLDNTRQFILESAATKEKKSVCVLGSGWLLDVPLEELSEMFDKVVLVDIIQPRQIKHKASKLGNVEVVETDITGGAATAVYELLKKKKKNAELQLADAEFDSKNFGLDVDISQFSFVVSVNLLNQLDILIVDHLIEQELFDNEQSMLLKKRIQKQHLNSLPIGKSCLISDYKEQVYNGEAFERSRDLVFVQLPKGNFHEKWVWKFDSSGRYYHKRKTYFDVKAIDF